MDYAYIQLDYTLDGQDSFFEHGYGKDRIRVAGSMVSFARLARMLNIRTIKIGCTDNKPTKSGLCYTISQAKECRTDLFTTLTTDSIDHNNKMKRGRKVAYTIIFVDPFTCVESDHFTFSL